MTTNRRPIEARNTHWAHAAARGLKQLGFTPNSVSLTSVVFAGCAGMAFYASRLDPAHSTLWLIGAAVLVQLRLLCNLFDGMIAVEFGLKSKSGEIYNDVPDRPADIFILIGTGYSLQSISWGSDLGWIAACLAVLTAYVRVLGVSAGASSYFIGPMAKQHRMATITGAALLTAAERSLFGTDYILLSALVIVSIGSAVTFFRRTFKIVKELESKP